MALDNVLSQKRLAVQSFIQEHGLGNVILHEMLGPSGPDTYSAMCTLCSYSVTWKFNINEEFGIELDALKSFCLNHRHGKEPLPKLSQLSQPSFSDGEFLTKSKIHEVVEKMKEQNLTIHPQMQKDIEEDGDPFNLLGSIKATVHNGRTITAVSSEALKFIARTSDFNVDLQCKQSFGAAQYRAVCSKCQEFIQVEREAVYALDRGQFAGNLVEFLKEHQHNSTTELPKGRKFRHASQQG